MSPLYDYSTKIQIRWVPITLKFCQNRKLITQIQNFSFDKPGDWFLYFFSKHCFSSNFDQDGALQTSELEEIFSSAPER